MIKQHSDLIWMMPYIKAVRDAIEGASKVRSEGYLYLPHPSAKDKTSPQSKARYEQYKAGAEWDSFPDVTERSMLGKLKLDKTNVQLPERISYLEDDVDGDGLTLKGAIAKTAKNILEVKWHVLLADYQGLSDLDVTQLSLSDIQILNPRAKIKQYTRENVINWQFDRINGVMQLTRIMLREVGYELTADNIEEEIESFLVLGLDETGYYQQKIVKTSDGEQEGEPSYVSVNGQVLQWIPIQIATDCENEAGEMPTGLGFLSSICDLAYARYRVSADYKEAMRLLPPTTNMYGVGEAEWESFKAVNGRDYVATGAGAVNLWDRDVQSEILSTNTELGGYERYFEHNKSKVQALGGVFKEDGISNKTATESALDSAEQNAVLVDVANGVEVAFEKIISYCAMFEGVLSADSLESEEIDIDITRDFDRAKLTAEEVKVILDLVLAGLMTQEQAIKKLVAGGWLEGEADQLIQELEMDGSINSPIRNENENTDSVNQEKEVVPNE